MIENLMLERREIKRVYRFFRHQLNWLYNNNLAKRATFKWNNKLLKKRPVETIEVSFFLKKTELKDIVRAFYILKNFFSIRQRPTHTIASVHQGIKKVETVKVFLTLNKFTAFWLMLQSVMCLV